MWAPERSFAQVCTLRPDGSGLEWLGRHGHVADLTWTDTMPGGNEQLTCTLQADPRWQPTFLDPGRLVRGVKGASVQWEGILDSPVPGDAGWSLSARGAGTWGGLYQAVCNTWTATDILNQAAARGLGWIVGTVTGGYLLEPQDSGSQTVTDFLNAYTSPGSQTWRVRRTPAGNQIDVFALPTVPTRILVSTVPAARTLAGYVNVLWVRYQATPDNTATGAPATYALTSATLPASIAKHGRQEAYWDLSSSGIMIAATAQALAQQALGKYTAASYAGPFTAAPGQYLTMGGTPVDHATESAGEVVQLIMADGPYGGEYSAAPPVQFPVGAVEYHDADGSLVVTPFQSVGLGLSGLLQALTPPAAAA